MTTTPTSGAADLPEALRSIQRFEVVDCIDDKHVPAVIPKPHGPWVRYEDHIAALAAGQTTAAACFSHSGRLNMQDKIEPTASEQAAWHAGLDEGRAQKSCLVQIQEPAVNQQLTTEQEPVTWLLRRSAFRASPDGQDAEGHEWLEEADEPGQEGSFPVYAAPVLAAQPEGPQAETIEEAARDVGKWLNERPNRPLDLRHVAMLAHHAQAGLGTSVLLAEVQDL